MVPDKLVRTKLCYWKRHELREDSCFWRFATFFVSLVLILSEADSGVDERALWKVRDAITNINSINTSLKARRGRICVSRPPIKLPIIAVGIMVAANLTESITDSPCSGSVKFLYAAPRTAVQAIVAAELAMARRRGIFKINCWVATPKAPPPMPSSPATKPIGNPTEATFQPGILFDLSNRSVRLI